MRLRKTTFLSIEIKYLNFPIKRKGNQVFCFLYCLDGPNPFCILTSIEFPSSDWEVTKIHRTTSRPQYRQIHVFTVIPPSFSNVGEIFKPEGDSRDYLRQPPFRDNNKRWDSVNGVVCLFD